MVEGDESCLRDLTPTDYVTLSFPLSGLRGSGIAFLVRKSLLSKTNFKSLSDASFEGVTVTLSFDQCVHLTAIYRPPPSRQNKLTNSMFVDEIDAF